ncbi:DegT/DnrJ/EryC1/StrS family aminotransferase [Streptomyces sp. NBC_01455]|uniref:DegT/DnrJ/EryC1/StrS family aminotransferase n=1 Tax=Streptomyces sp. NBC_01455 TaxID=2903874 RepID=UPI002E2F5A08|nr:DegT/DnrJ/EryC1/StrS family aminotransferase [Streptomyces sp. NBC_01455]
MTRHDGIPYTRPSITELEIGYVLDAATHGWGEHCYDYIRRFERAFADHVGVPCAVSTSSATGALHLGLAALGIGPGDEVIAPDITWIASVAPAIHLGATVRFADIDPVTWCVTPESVESRITDRTRAVIAVHLYGNPCDVVGLAELCEKRGVALIEDAAEGIGTLIDGHRAGSLGRFSVFSFHGTKTLTSGEGGMLVTRDTDLAGAVRVLNNHGRAPGRAEDFVPETIGYKYRMSNLQAALGLGQVERLDELMHRKTRILELYRERLDGLLSVRLNTCRQQDRLGAWMPTAECVEPAGIRGQYLREVFFGAGIDARVVFPSLSTLPMFEQTSDVCPTARAFAARAVNLPSYHDMSMAEIDRVCATLEKAITGYGCRS